MQTFKERLWWKSPKYPDFPRSEYEKREAKARKLMEEKNIDLLVLWDEENLRYFTGYNNTHWDCKTLQCGVYLLPLDREGTMVIPYLFRGTVEGSTYVRNIMTQEEAHRLQQQRDFPVEVANAINELGYGKKRIGIEAGRQGGMYIPRPLNDIERWKSELSDAKFVEAADIIWECRMIKSEAEIATIKKANDIVMAAYHKFLDSFELGMTLRDVGILLEKACVERGGERFKSASMSVTRNYPMFDSPHYYDVPISKGDRIMVEFGCRYKGYRSGFGRNVQVGKPSKNQEELDRRVNEAQRAAVDIVKPGISAKEVTEVANSVLKKGGAKQLIDMVGHGIGLTPHEPPMLEATEGTKLREGMVLAVEVWQMDVPLFESLGKNLGVYGGEDTVVVTKDGCDELTFREKEVSYIHL